MKSGEPSPIILIFKFLHVVKENAINIKINHKSLILNLACIVSKKKNEVIRFLNHLIIIKIFKILIFYFRKRL